MPKPMLPVAGRPVLEHNVRLLAAHGVRDITINLHHCPEVVTAHFGDGARWGVRLSYSHEATLLGTAGAAANVAPPFASTFLVLYGDSLIGCDVGALLAFHQQQGATATIGLAYQEDPRASGIVEVAEDGRVQRFLEKPGAGEVFSHWVNGGLLALEPEALSFIPRGRPSDFGREALPAVIAAGRPVYGYRGPFTLHVIDTPEDYQRAQALARAGRLALP